MLTLEQIGEKAPSALAEAPASKVSDRYTFVPTTKIISDMADLGWFPYDAKESQVRDESRDGYQKHFLQFRNEEYSKSWIKEGDSVPQIMVTNAHDATSSFRLAAGVFRLVCSNGMVVGDIDMDTRIKHMGYDMQSVEKVVSDFAGRFDQVQDTIEVWKNKTLSFNQIYEFAAQARNVRWPEGEGPQFLPSELTSVRRSGDRGQSLWSVFNRAQEGIIRGGFQAKSRKSGRKVGIRAVGSIDKYIGYNQALWNLAEEFANN